MLKKIPTLSNIKKTKSQTKAPQSIFVFCFLTLYIVTIHPSDSEQSIYQSLHLANKTVWETMCGGVSCVFLLLRDKSVDRARRSVPLLLEGPAICPLASEWHSPKKKRGERKKNTGNVAGNVSKQMRADCGLGFFLR